MTRTFTLTDEQLQKAEEWQRQQMQLVKESQEKHNAEILAREDLTEDEKESQMFPEPLPYPGVIGGSLSYIFTPTSLGVGVSVQNSITKNELDITDYNTW